MRRKKGRMKEKQRVNRRKEGREMEKGKNIIRNRKETKGGVVGDHPFFLSVCRVQ